MSDDQPWLRPHLLPGLLDAARRNYSRGFKNFSLFEMGSIFRKSIDLGKGTFPDTGVRPDAATIQQIYSEVPTQLDFVCGVLIGSTGTDSWRNHSRSYEWADAVAEVENILRLLNLTWTVERSDLAPWHPGRCAEFIVNGKPIAHAGELHPRVVQEFGLPARSAAWGLNLDLLPLSPLVNPQPVGTMPATIQDIALIVDSNIEAHALESALREGAGDLLESITLFDRYESVGDGKVSLAFTLVFRALDRTLTGEEVAGYRASAVQQAADRCGAKLRS
jgi:phenylalanyl-tRNA synthetase beta chain